MSFTALLSPIPSWRLVVRVCPVRFLVRVATMEKRSQRDKSETGLGFSSHGVYFLFSLSLSLHYFPGFGPPGSICSTLFNPLQIILQSLSLSLSLFVICFDDDDNILRIPSFYFSFVLVLARVFVVVSFWFSVLSIRISFI